MMILMSAFCCSGIFAILTASSSISCCSLYENAMADLSLSVSSSSESEADFVDFRLCFGTGEICVNESFDESADEVGGVVVIG